MDYIPELGESKPQGENKLEGVVEWEPVDSVDSAFEDSTSHIRFHMRQRDPISYVKKEKTTQY
jgi:hypothetical protein